MTNMTGFGVTEALAGIAAQGITDVGKHLYESGRCPNSGSLVWRCCVRDITSFGARLEFHDAPVLPTEFNLTFDAKTLRRCRLKWRIANEVGVSFQFPKKT